MWRYEAIDLREPGNPVRRTGEIAGETAAEARASLRAIGLQVLAIAPDRAASRIRVPRLMGVSMFLRTWRPRLHASVSGVEPARGHSFIQSLLRGRRVQERADAFDALATLLESGVPLSEAVEALAEAGEGQSRPLRRVLLAVREDLRAGRPLSVAL
ncbi:MAG: type II secretion system F family protein, partial [Phycisphaerae bacterium]|nr:type II secretion system F family protein [Phycisphaerae bacterium]